MNMLMRELPSPNVTQMIDIYLTHELYSPSQYDIISHGRGVFEFRPSNSHLTESILKTTQKAFQKYALNEAIYPVSTTGLKEIDGNGIGSTRFCTMDSRFASYLTDVISGRSVVDIIKDNNHWMQMINVSQYFRFMKYESGGEHFPHYDSDFVYEYNGAVTKYSLVVYFNDCDTGELAFVNDDTSHSGDCTDWERQATDDEIWLKIKPSCMKIVLFPHTLCHTVLPFTDENNTRYICRGDILFNNINTGLPS
jgi:hypothetical protein